jgi:hypothetical protein
LYCTQCGSEIPDQAAFCSSCGQSQWAGDNHGPSRSEQSLKWLVPINVSPYAVVSCYSGLFGFLFCILVVPSLLAIVMGVLALSDLKKNPHLSGKGRAWFGLVTGSLSLVIALIILISWGLSPDP